MKDHQRILIIGGGLSGLTVAYLLSKRNIHAKVLEASERLGGRIQTIKGSLQTPLELGATWFSEMHPNLLALISDLGNSIYPQYSRGISLFQTKSFEPPQEFHVPESDNPSYRLAGGTQMLIDSLASKLLSDNILLNSKVIAIQENGEKINVITKDGKVHVADKVILCIPPQLIAKNINFDPSLPEEVNELLPSVQTWMAGAIKFAIEYKTPFWRNKGFSGMLYSHAGIITEMYDHTNYEGNKFGFTGFLNGGAASYLPEVRREYVLRQLADMLGEESLTPTTYSDKVWTDEFILADSQIIHRPHQNNGHPVLQKEYMSGKLFFGATETATQFPGYMEGAVIAAQRLVDKL
ncbi:flavin monoamine oxidase family protein [Sphingobacterium sp. WOUb80]|uniref:flavin monoamine oxidase family protein n=1 Tax=Sphingobacterium sp. WOUb80 TaxID=3234028 RepID=UPI003CF38519